MDPFCDLIQALSVLALDLGLEIISPEDTIDILK
jgi:hypothetical protein